ncbi:MAG: sulfur carrier protein ThiS [Planctomycetota bacterium]|jgi:sulfur carrier protein|nr:sulfur carrier protein ThiS [Planctomycetota bacterium]
MITIEFNGVQSEVDEKTTMEDLLRLAKVESRFCAVELNLEILPKDHYASQVFCDGDKIEVVTLVGGG